MSSVTKSNPLTQQSPRVGETIIFWLLRAAGYLSILTTVGIVFILFEEAFFFFTEVSFVSFLTDTAWRPFSSPESDAFQIGIFPLIHGTLIVTLVAMVVAIPLGLASAVYLADYAAPRVRKILKPTLEVLAGVPTVVLGYFALTAMTPLLRSILGEGTVDFFNPMSAGIVMGIMIVPTIASLSEDAMSAVPDSLRMGAYGLGATKRQVVTQVIFPAALSGIVAAIILAMGRAVGETMIVALAAGNLPRDLSDGALGLLNPFEQVQTMTSYIVQAVQGEAPRGSVTYESIFAVGATLFLMTLGLNIAAQRFVRRFREAY
ncbi:phosphate ABC transporter permease subunit PstC [Euzebya tangerina]|uniref:phosphate ABC transporter permease subunit PstC n=1 Tax=Euzebya tangerina TaxID=591198 RepID=UPI000E30FC8F|nr:phosphate ABC transporter permease subunit PstC [Euzebya tangerina]